MISLNRADWAEIYYALEAKCEALSRGDYSPEFERGEDAKWIAHLEAIKAKIGSGGIDAASEGVARTK
jgi:hypothetical protein